MATLLEVKDLRTYFYTFEGVVKAVDGVSYEVEEGETLGLVGESGCGKSVSALSVMRLIPDPPGKIVDGEINFDGEDILKVDMDDMRHIRGAKIAMVFQEPMTSLNPVLTVEKQLSETLQLHKGMTRDAARRESINLLARVGIPDPEQRVNQYPHQFSGGMRQRVMIAMALACHPKLLIADEPTTALDVTIQAQTLKLINDLKHDRDLAIMFITHDLGVVAQVADVVCVMYGGTVVEYADVFELFRNPLHPYTRGLLDSIPRIGRRQSRLKTIDDVRKEEEVSFILPGARRKSLAWWPQGMRNRQDPACLLEIVPGHWVACTSEPEEELQVSVTPNLSFVRDDDRER